MQTNRAHAVVDSLRPTSFPREPLIGMCGHAGACKGSSCGNTLGGRRIVWVEIGGGLLGL
jgi:hypothetical protein